MKKYCLKTLLAAGIACGGALYAEDSVEVPAMLPGMSAPKAEEKVEFFSWDKVPEIVAVVGEKQITKADLQKTMESFGEIPADCPADQVMMILYSQTQMLIKQALLEDKLAAEGIGPLEDLCKKTIQDELDNLPAEQKEQLTQELAAQNMTLDDFIKMIISNPAMQMDVGILELGSKYNKDLPAITAEDTKKFYDENPGNFIKTPASVEVSHILLQTSDEMDEAAVEKRINELHAEVTANPEKFAEIAKAESKCPSSADGGALGMSLSSATSNIDPVFLAASLDLDAGEISPVVTTQFGSHIIMCTKKTPEEKEVYTPELEAKLIEVLTLNRNFEAGAKAMADYESTVEVTNNLPAPAFNPMMMMQ
jgi:parvulin-like peptidyl-prolyl isomerase